ncbi:bifunctional riboflavin kinase/FAD synthetase [Pelomicrobium methylotrophicum]|uniref:Riboflavin biosynthesis protein n=1 Tax=Pelomicrobium methylotrophicum TaxID=2602750 RepID=A0A5C7EIY2_9PROT|nr:bifunctional riboflavin kinase/FAD synthetase [Pelomicrobium methylotrophicum]TXF12047.1 bifunctional riboflavin kinase/FAD synthetase [Pelomicrobium methylotrophicum]
MVICRGIPRASIGPLALTIGNFDGVHLGHQAVFSRLVAVSRALGAPACVMTFEPHPREFFAPEQAPTRLTSLREKLELLARFGIERVQIIRFDGRFAQVSAEAFVTDILHRALGVRWLLVGDDFRFGARRAGDFQLLVRMGKTLGFDVEAMPTVTVGELRVSSTAVRAALARGDLNTARQLLGRPYSISGRVVDGQKLGKKLGFPTANVLMKRNRPPFTGIFAVEVEGIDRRPLRGVASLGVRPTIHEKGHPTLEVHLFDFDRLIYGRHLRVNFLAKLRDEEKYPDLETLARQIGRDVENAHKFFASLDQA